MTTRTSIKQPPASAKRPKRETAPRKRTLKREPQRPETMPFSIQLPRDVYDRLLALAQWADATPSFIDLGEHAWDAIDEALTEPIDEDLFPPGVGVMSVQVETRETAAEGRTRAGMLVVLVETVDAPEGAAVWDWEVHVRIEPAPQVDNND